MSADLPPVIADEAADDRVWFDLHPRRRYRLREGADGWWCVRRRSGDVLLRTSTTEIPPGLPDDDYGLREVWFLAAYPDSDPVERDELIKRARQAEHTKPHRGRAGTAQNAGRGGDGIHFIPIVEPTGGN
jgi:hypothetical protein